MAAGAAVSRPECGAAPVDGAGCREMLGLVCAWEVDDPELAAAHFLTVASYNLQHPAAITDEATSGLRAMLIDAIDCGVPAAELRRRAGRMFAGARRVRRVPVDRDPVLRCWEMTIADI
ncbi:MAG TPA: DUF5946 family protein, partial [Thermomicrobiales bacterium]|nr:DUF5946 family protein [Thermomicrobiales bacterium]